MHHRSGTAEARQRGVVCATLSIIDDASSSATVLLSAAISPSLPHLAVHLESSKLRSQGEGWARVHEFADHVTVARKLDWPRYGYVPLLGIQAELLVIDLHGLGDRPRVSPCDQRFQLNRGRTGVFI